MNCPVEIEQSLLQILQRGILKCRLAGWEGNAQRCALECDHIHNLPILLSNYSLEALQYYYEVEREAYLVRSLNGAAEFHEEWDVLAEFLEHQPAA